MTDIWSLSGCKSNAQKYPLYATWKREDRDTYRAALRNGWLLECCRHMSDFPVEKLSACKESAQRFTLKEDWAEADPEMYTLAKNRYWLTECCKHMPNESPRVNKHLKWSYENCLNSVKSCTTTTEWRRKFNGAYKSAKRNGWLDEFDSMLDAGESNLIRADKWNPESCMDSAKDYNNPYLWQIANPEAFIGAVRNKCLKECTSHMKNNTKILTA